MINGKHHYSPLLSLSLFLTTTTTTTHAETEKALYEDTDEGNKNKDKSSKGLISVTSIIRHREVAPEIRGRLCSLPCTSSLPLVVLFSSLVFRVLRFAFRFSPFFSSFLLPCRFCFSILKSRISLLIVVCSLSSSLFASFILARVVRFSSS
jgi:hypothetical protein